MYSFRWVIFSKDFRVNKDGEKHTIYDFYYQKEICYNMQGIPQVVIFQVSLGGFYKKRKKLSTVQTHLMEHTKMIAPPFVFVSSS